MHAIRGARAYTGRPKIAKCEGVYLGAGLEPDPTTLGKVIGGGLPIGTVAGTEEAMAVYDSSTGKATCPQSGTFTANPLSMAAGVAAMRMFTRENVERLNALGESARAKLREAFRIAGCEGQLPARACSSSST